MNSKSSRKPAREQSKSLDPKDEVEINSEYYGDEDNISSQTVTNYYYSPHR
jgi:hypothetical protein